MNNVLKIIENKAKSILCHSKFNYLAILIAILLALPSLRIGFVLEDNWQRISISNDPSIPKKYSDLFNTKGVMNAYSFFTGSSQRNSILMNKGVIPWWSDLKMKLNFWRPVSGLLLQLDYTYYPANPMLMHLHSIIWFVFLIILIGIIFRNFFGQTWFTGLATLLFVINSVNYMPVFWIAARHALVASVFGAGSIIFFYKWYLKQNYFFYTFSLLLFCLSILSSEVGIVTFAFILSYTFFIIKDKITLKIKILIPWLLTIILWRVLYSTLGYGVSNTELYIDPFVNPLRFFFEIILRIPFLIFGIIGFPPADIYLFLSNNLIIVYSVIFWLLVIGIIILSGNFLKRNKVILFWLGSFFFSLIPLCSAMPSNRYLSIPALFGIGSLVQIFQVFLSRNSSEKRLSRSVKNLFCYLGVMLLIISPISVFGNAYAMEIFEMKRITDYVDDKEINKKDLVLVNAPGNFSLSFLLPNYFFEYGKLPIHFEILSPGFTMVRIKRIDLFTLSVKPEVGYFAPPGIKAGEMNLLNNRYSSFVNFLRRLERLIQSGESSFRKNQIIKTSFAEVKIKTLTVDDRPSEVEYRFAFQLECKKIRWRTWNSRKYNYEEFVLPKVGESVLIN